MTPVPVGPALAELAAEWRRERRRVLRDPDPEPVHRLRTATRRLRVGVTIATEDLGVGAAPSWAGWKQLRRRLGRLRDLDVLREALKALRARPGGESDEALADLLACLRRRRRRLRDRALPAVRAASLRRILAAVEPPTAPGRRAGAGQPLDRAAVERIAARWWTRSAEALAAEPAWQLSPAVNSEDPAHRAAFHAARVRARGLRYGLEWWARLGLRPRAETVEFLGAVQDALGAIRDGWRARRALAGPRFQRARSILVASLGVVLAGWPGLAARRDLLGQPGFDGGSP